MTTKLTDKKFDLANSPILAKIRKFGGHMSNMVMPNLGAFVGWGLLTAIVIPNGWFPNEHLAKMVGPILNYLFPLLIGYTAGYNIHGQRGGVLGAFTSMGVIIGSDITMISGAMIMGPLSAWILKKFDLAFSKKIRPGFEMFFNNFSLGIIGAILLVFAYISIGPIIRGLIVILTAGVQWCTEHNTLPLLSVFMAPAQVLFLNNVVNHGILAPIGFAQVPELGKSIMFLVDTNNGPLLGTLMAIALFGRGRAKNTAPMAMFIAGIAGIGEVYFPFVLANPILVFATMGGLATSLTLQVMLGGGLIGVASPGSLIAIAMMTPANAAWANFISILAGFIVSCALGYFLLKFSPGGDEDPSEGFSISVGNEKKQIKTVETIIDKKLIKTICVACDSGMGSSAMGATILRKTLQDNGFSEIVVTNSRVNDFAEDVDLVITLESLIERAKISSKSNKTKFIAVKNFISPDDYKEVIELLKSK